MLGEKRDERVVGGPLDRRCGEADQKRVTPHPVDAGADGHLGDEQELR